MRWDCGKNLDITGAIIDECIELFEQLTIFSQELIQFNEEAKCLKMWWMILKGVSVVKAKN